MNDTTDDKTENTQQQAIADYLEALLLEVPEANEPSPVPQYKEPQPTTVGLEQLVETIPEVVEVTAVEDTVVVEQDLAVEPQLDSSTLEDEIPDWAMSDFQCLLFKVSGLTLAVPLVKLNSVVPWTDKIVETPNQTDWYLGLVQNLGKSVKVIDTALMVLPENRRANVAEDPAERFSHILLVDDSRWGLACDSIGDVIWLSADKVKWRKSKRQRPWLAGTALDQLCAVMDTEVFAGMLNDQASS